MSCVFSLSFLLAAESAMAQEASKAQAPALTAEQIIDKSIEAVGGKEKLEKMKTRYIKGSLEFKAMGMKGSFESFSKMPNKKIDLTSMDGFGEMQQGFDGKIGWSKDPMNGLRELEGMELAMYKRDAVFNSELRWRENYKEAKSTGTKSTVEGKEVYEVEFIPAEGKPVTVYYDAESFLPFMTKMVVDSPYGTLPAKMFPTDYKEVEGVKFPHSLRQVVGPQEILITMTEIKHNIEIEDSKFNKPAEEGEEKPKEEKKPN